MEMFDVYRPADTLACPVCQRPLRKWQGTDGPCVLFVWAEGVAGPVDHLVDEDKRVSPEKRAAFGLPGRFRISSRDCPEHRPIEAECESDAGVWRRTVVLPFAPARGRGGRR